MKALIAILTLLLGVVCRVSAGGERGTAERILYFASYLAEEIYVKDAADFTIAPGCGAALGNRDVAGLGKRCNFFQFCQHIWEPTTDSNPARDETKNGAPSSDAFKDIKGGVLGKINSLKAFNAVPYETLFQLVQSWNNKYTNTILTAQNQANGLNSKGEPKTDEDRKKDKVTSQITLNKKNSAARTVPSAIDWYDSLSKSSRPLQILREKLDSGEVKDIIDPDHDGTSSTESEDAGKDDQRPRRGYQALCSYGAKAADRVVELRRFEFELGPGGKGQGRLLAFERSLRGNANWMPPKDQRLWDNKDFIVGIEEDSLRSGVVDRNKKFWVLDVLGTLAKNRETMPDIETRLNAAMDDYTTVKDGDSDVRKLRIEQHNNHIRALKSAEDAVRGCKCNVA